MRPILFVTSNSNKAKEAEKILGYPLEIANIALDEIQSFDINEVVRKKAESAFSILKKPLIVEDVGAYFAAWNGFPGPFIKFLYETGGESHELTLKMLEGFEDKSVEVRAVIGYHDGKQVHLIEGSFKGKLVSKRGDHGWGFDPFVIPEGYDKTFGELPENVKNQISHRARALRSFRDFLDKEEK